MIFSPISSRSTLIGSSISCIEGKSFLINNENFELFDHSFLENSKIHCVLEILLRHLEQILKVIYKNFEYLKEQSLVEVQENIKIEEINACFSHNINVILEKESQRYDLHQSIKFKYQKQINTCFQNKVSFQITGDINKTSLNRTNFLNEKNNLNDLANKINYSDYMKFVENLLNKTNWVEYEIIKIITKIINRRNNISNNDLISLLQTFPNLIHQLTNIHFSNCSQILDSILEYKDGYEKFSSEISKNNQLSTCNEHLIPFASWAYKACLLIEMNEKLSEQEKIAEKEEKAKEKLVNEQSCLNKIMEDFENDNFDTKILETNYKVTSILKEINFACSYRLQCILSSLSNFESKYFYSINLELRDENVKINRLYLDFNNLKMSLQNDNEVIKVNCFEKKKPEKYCCN